MYDHGDIFQITEYTADRWVSWPVGPDEWRRSGCEKAAAASGEIVPVLEAITRQGSTMPDTPEFAKRKADALATDETMRQMKARRDAGLPEDDPATEQARYMAQRH